MISIQKLFSNTIEKSTIPSVVWSVPERDIFYNTKGIHIWRIKWIDLSSQLYLKYLSEDEYRKFLCTPNPKTRNLQIICRGILKELSAKYLNLELKSLTLKSNPLGKPYFANPYNHLQFNISYSTDFILMAFDFQNQDIGIDIEENKLLFNYLDIADQYFSKDEKTSLNCKTPAEQFFKVWTRKEALVKSKGTVLTDEIVQAGVLMDEIHLEESYFLKTFKNGPDHIFSIVSKAPPSKVCILWNIGPKKPKNVLSAIYK